MAVRLGVCFCALLAVGCQKDVSQRDAYIRELRMQEDQIYEMQDYMSEYQELLRRQRRENARLKKQLVTEPSTSIRTLGDEEEDGLLNDDMDDDMDDDIDERSLLDRSTESETPDDDIGLPEIDMGEPTLPEIDMGEPLPMEGPEEIPAGDEGGAFRQPAAPIAQQVSANMELDESELVDESVFEPPPMPIQRADSCAIYAEQTPIEPTGETDLASSGLMVIVEPLTQEGSAGAFTGELSLMLLDPIASEDDREIARWDFTPEEVEAAWRDVSRRVLDLPIATPAGAPVGRPLELWVRMIPTARDQKILSHTGIKLVEPVRLIGVAVSGVSSTVVGGQVSTGWMAADQLRSPARVPDDRPSSWRPAAMLPPAAVASASVPSEPKRPPAKPARPQEWSPFR